MIMKKFCVLFALTLLSNYAIAQDKVVLKSGDTLSVNVTKNTETTIEFTYPGETVVNEKKKRDISCIIYASGRREEFKIPTPVIPVINNKNDWEKVIVTTNRDDVSGLTMVKSLAVNGGGGIMRTSVSSKEIALKLLKKKVAKLKCGIVLVTNEDYQLLTGYTLSGEAYKQ